MGLLGVVESSYVSMVLLAGVWRSWVCCESLDWRVCRWVESGWEGRWGGVWGSLEVGVIYMPCLIQKYFKQLSRIIHKKSFVSFVVSAFEILCLNNVFQGCH